MYRCCVFCHSSKHHTPRSDLVSFAACRAHSPPPQHVAFDSGARRGAHDAVDGADEAREDAVDMRGARLAVLQAVGSVRAGLARRHVALNKLGDGQLVQYELERLGGSAKVRERSEEGAHLSEGHKRL